MDYIEVNCQVEPADQFVEIVIARLAERGYEAFEETDTGLKAYIRKSLFNENYLNALKDLDNLGARIICTHQLIPDQNWNSVWESNFEPVTVKNEVYVRADFHPANTDIPYEIVIHPKMAFGTGHHATTALMMECMLDLTWKGKEVLDMGCGTGILAILAEKLGAQNILAIDNDEAAVSNAAENAQVNKCKKINCRPGDAGSLKGLHFDVILANINRNIILSDIAQYVSSMNDGSLLLLSGFYCTDEPMITAEAYNLSLKLINQKEIDNWCCLVFKKQTAA